MELALEILCHMLASEQPRLSSHVPSASMPSTTRQIQRLPLLEMEMDSHGGLKVTIRQTEWKKKTTQQLRGTDL